MTCVFFQINLDAGELWLPDVVPYNGEQVKPHAVGFRDDMSKVKQTNKRKNEQKTSEKNIIVSQITFEHLNH
jgi:hypothetical protein